MTDPATQAQATSLLRLHVKSARPEPVGRTFSDAAIQIALASYPGFSVSRPPSAGTPYGIYRPAYVPQGDVPHRVVNASGKVTDIPPPSPPPSPASGADWSFRDGESVQDAPLGDVNAPLGESRRMPLGRLALARSGDKGGDANVGVWIPADHPRRADAYAWLAGFLDEATIRGCCPKQQRSTSRSILSPIWPPSTS
ncbi:hypothetical protein [Aeromicrobium sp. UC242_57]|uniref:acyclic terpene utilization AtuA family protein n=1 Tax=Aeromicrobium sp. UC242_57 TaxID=3374624 RepID=UPI0037B6B48C